MAVSGHYAYVAAWTDGLRIYDVANPAKPVLAGASTALPQLPKVWSYPAITLSSRTIIMGLAFSISPIHQTRSTSATYPAPANQGNPLHITISGNYVYLTGTYSSMYVFDVSDPANPKQQPPAASKMDGCTARPSRETMPTWAITMRRTSRFVPGRAGRTSAGASAHTDFRRALLARSQRGFCTPTELRRKPGQLADTYQ